MRKRILFLLRIILIMTRCNSLNDEKLQKIIVKIDENPMPINLKIFTTPKCKKTLFFLKKLD
ncbi:hypothetical protein [Bacillus thuringiensis]|uniref:hypothetical protein n=1 Tax=Bacillus thuringiensis TaxID=1428 RepID=UPI002157FCCE|nr:hypothetical protein [Bacillus thuringiensis]MCR6851847.1 hypothetical protein [Bacillus thuringiensis]